MHVRLAVLLELLRERWRVRLHSDRELGLRDVDGLLQWQVRA